MTPVATAPPAHADFEDLIIQPIVDAIGQVFGLVDPGLLGLVDPGVVDVDALVVPALAAGLDGPALSLVDPGLLSVVDPGVVDAGALVTPALAAAFDGPALSLVDPGLLSVVDPGVVDVDALAAPATAALDVPAGSLADPDWLTALVPGWLTAADPGAVDVDSVATSAATAATTTADESVNATVPLYIHAGIEPIAHISISGGPTIPVVVDTGSEGLVVPWWSIGFEHLLRMPFPTGLGIGGYSGGLYYLYITFPETVSFGNGIVTAPTDVNVVLLSFPNTLSGFLNPMGAAGVMGIGPNAAGPGTSTVITALPGDLNQGVLIDEANGLMTFGPNPGTPMFSLEGAPFADVMVQINDGPLHALTANIDSGGVYGTMPSSLLGGQLSGTVPAGTEISVYSSDGDTLLYSYVTDATNGPTVTSGAGMNTGYMPFSQNPIYIGYSPHGVGTTTFNY